MATHTNGFGDSLYCSQKAMILRLRAVTLWKVSRLMARWLTSANQRST